MSANAVVLERLTSPADDLDYGATGLTRNRVFILPTRQGVLYAVMLFVMLLGAINYNNSMGFVLCFFLASLALVCILHTYRNLRGLILTSGDPEPVFAGEIAQFPVTLNNRSGTKRHALEFSSVKKRSFRKKRDHPAAWQVNFDIDAEKQEPVFLPLQTKYRGHHSINRVRIAGRFPLGLFRAWSYYDIDNKCLVYPRPAGSDHLPEHSLLANEQCDGGMSGVDDFSGFKKYTPGDPIKMISWKALARGQELMVKQFIGKGARKLMFNWQLVRHLENTEARLSQLCKWILIAEQQGFLYGLELPHIVIEPKQGMPHKRRCLEELALFRGR